jgi:microcystin-dependent protein
MQQHEELLGTIKLFAGFFAPVGYCPCDGREVEIARFPNLFSIIGTMYGGNGVTHFGLPNLKDKEPDPNLSYIICVEGVYPGRP